MAVLKSCCCCSLLLGTIISGIYTMLVYLLAFIITVWWIAESEMGLGPATEVGVVPLPGYLLGIGYMVVFVMSIIMLHGLYKRKEIALLAWLFVMVLFFFPEMGIVLFMSLYHWRITTSYGLADLVFYTFRAAINLVCLLCVQAQYSTWREQTTTDHTLKRLEHMQMNQFVSGSMTKMNADSSLGYHNPGFVTTETVPTNDLSNIRSIPLSRTPGPSQHNLNVQSHHTMQQNLTRSISSASQFAGYAGNTRGLRASNARIGIRGWDPYIQNGRGSQSEFNAAIFSSPGSVPVLTHSRSEYSIYQENPRSSSGNYNHHSPIRRSNLLQSEGGYHSPLYYTPAILHPDFSTQSLDRRKYHHKHGEMSSSVEALNLGATLGPHRGPFMSYNKPSFESKSSLGAESDDLRRYRDVAL